MSDRNSTPQSRPRDFERYAELSDLLGDLNEKAPIRSADPIMESAESPSLESSFASVDAAFPIRPREVTISKAGFDGNRASYAGGYSRATPVLAPIAPIALDAWDLRPTLEPKDDQQAEPYFESPEQPLTPAITMPEPELSDEDAFQSVLEGLEDDILSDTEITNYAEPVFEAPFESRVTNPDTYESVQEPQFHPHAAAFSEPAVEVATSFDPTSEFDRVFDDAIFDDLPAEFLPLEHDAPSHAQVNYEALRPQSSRETTADAADVASISMSQPDGYSDAPPSVFVDTSSPYSEVPTTGSLYVPEFVVAEETAPQNISSYDDYEIEDYQAVKAQTQSPATFSDMRETVVNEQVVTAQHYNDFNDLDDIKTEDLVDDDFARAFENELNPTDELATIVGSSFDDDPLLPSTKADDFVPMPPLAPIVPKSAGKAKWVVSSALVLVLAGIVGYTLFSGSDLSDGGEPAIVRADNEPIRVAPDNPGGTVVPNQDRVVFNEVGGGAVVPEQPQETLVEGRQEPAIEADALKQDERVLSGDATAEPDLQNTPAIAPRAVQTVTVRPDGTLVVNPQVDQAPPSAQAEVTPEVRPLSADNNLAISADGSQAQTPASEAAPTIADAQNSAQPAEPANTVANKVPARVVELKPVTQKPKAKTNEAASQEAKALDAVPSRPSDQPVNIVNGDAPVVPSQPAEQQVAVAEPAPVPAAGSYSIQIASTPSEEAATSTLRSLSSKFGAVLGGKDYAIQKAEVPGKGTMFRVRILAGSKDDAAKLCARYKSAGGSCFVTR